MLPVRGTSRYQSRTACCLCCACHASLSCSWREAPCTGTLHRLCTQGCSRRCYLAHHLIGTAHTACFPCLSPNPTDDWIGTIRERHVCLRETEPERKRERGARRETGANAEAKISGRVTATRAASAPPPCNEMQLARLHQHSTAPPTPRIASAEACVARFLDGTCTRHTAHVWRTRVLTQSRLRAQGTRYAQKLRVTAGVDIVVLALAACHAPSPHPATSAGRWWYLSCFCSLLDTALHPDHRMHCRCSTRVTARRHIYGRVLYCDASTGARRCVHSTRRCGCHLIHLRIGYCRLGTTASCRLVH